MVVLNHTDGQITCKYVYIYIYIYIYLYIILFPGLLPAKHCAARALQVHKA